MARIGLSTYIFLGVAGTTALSSLALGVMEGRRTEEASRHAADAQLRLSADGVAREARAVGEGHLRAMELLAGELEVADDWRANLDSRLAALRTRYGGLSFIYAADPTGRSFAADSRPEFAVGRKTVGIDYSDRDYMQRALQTHRTAVSAVEVGRVSGIPAVHLAVPVIGADGQLLGALGAALDLEQTERVVRAVASASSAQHLQVLDRVGHLVAASSDAPAALLPLGVQPTQGPGGVRQVTGSDGRRLHLMAAPVGGALDWVVVAFEAEDDIDAEAVAARRRIFWLALVAVAASLLVSAAMARWLGRPIRELAAAAEHAGQGAPVPTPRPRWGEPREVAILERVFGTMLARLRAYTGELETTVADRTRDLASANQLLERRLAQLHETQARLGLADRMASVGSLAAGVAHEINNPLTYVMGNIEFAREELELVATDWPADARPLSEVRAALQEAQEGTQRVKGIVKDLKMFSRAEDDSVGPVDTRGVLEACIKMATNELRHRASLETRFGSSRRVLGNEGRLSQVFLNLLINSAHAIAEGAVDRNTVRVITRDVDAGVAIDIEDTGQGIAPENLAKVFDPFFTTKPVGQGTGLGLAISQRIVAALGGRVTIESTVGQGTRVTVTLPAAEEPAPDAHPASAAPAVVTPRLRVLAIDDDAPVLRILERIIAREHTFTGLTDAREALRHLAEGRGYDLVLCDVMMPQMSGMEFFTALQASHPQLARRVVFTTGGTFSATAREFVERSGRQLVTKPFTVADIKAVISTFGPA